MPHVTGSRILSLGPPGDNEIHQGANASGRLHNAVYPTSTAPFQAEAISPRECRGEVSFVGLG